MFPFLVSLTVVLVLFMCLTAYCTVFAIYERFTEKDKTKKGEANMVAIFFASSTWSCGYLSYLLLCVLL